MVDVLIIGGGPVGLSSALTPVRQRHSVILFDTNKYRALPSAKIYGITNFGAIPPQEYLNTARAELSKYKHCTTAETEVVELIQRENRFEAKNKQGKLYQGQRVILANGVKDCFPDIEGYAEVWGKGIFNNPFCQGYQSNPWMNTSGVLAVDWIAMPKFAMHLTYMLSQLTSTVTIYIHGNTPLALALGPLPAKGINKERHVIVDTRTIVRLALKDGNATAVELSFTDGTTKTEGFLGHAPVAKVNGPFAEQLGIELAPSGEYKVSGLSNATSVKDVFAAGDAMNMFKMWPNAVATGAVTAAGVAIGLQEERWGLDPVFG